MESIYLNWTEEAGSKHTKIVNLLENFLKSLPGC